MTLTITEGLILALIGYIILSERRMSRVETHVKTMLEDIKNLYHLKSKGD